MIPKTINICGIPHEVKLVDDNFTGDTHFGEIEYAKSEIRINKNLPEPMAMQTLIHEWVHGALVLLGFTEDTNDEQFVQAMAMAINQTFDVEKEKTK